MILLELSRELRIEASVGVLIGTALLTLGALPAFAGSLPANGKYVAGSGSIQASSGNLLVNQSSTRGIISWQSFSIGQGETVQFDNGSGSTLNEVTGINASQIAGSLRATGSVYLVNPSGVIVTSTGRVLTQGSFGASTRAVSNSAFMDNGSLQYSGGASSDIANAGAVVSASGDVSLNANNVGNSGTISVMRGGHVWLTGADTANISGIVSAQNSDGAGGSIVVTGAAINVSGQLNARGTTQGGSIAVGDWSSHAVNVGKQATLDASAISSGNGGQISVIAAQTTFSGTARVQGGAISGNGGTIETSGHALDFTGAHVYASAARGVAGTWLLDPYNLTIHQAAAQTIDTSLNSGTNVLLKTTATGTSGPGVSTSGLGDILIDYPLNWNSGATLTLDAYHSVLVDAAVSVAGLGGLDIITDDGGSGGVFALAPDERVTFADLSSKLKINGARYTLVDDIASLAADIEADPDGSFALANNYDATGDGTYSSSPILTTFDGTFDGLGNTISNLKISDPSTDANNSVGLFAQAGAQATLLNINLLQANVSGGTVLGALVGENFGTISQSYVGAELSGGAYGYLVGGIVGSNYGSIVLSHFHGQVSGYGDLGGLVGWNYASGVIAESYSTGSVTGTSTFDNGTYIGGLAAENDGRVVQSFSNDSVSSAASNAYGGTEELLGGLVGVNTGTILQSHATGAVAYSGSDSAAIGGLDGYNNGLIDRSYATGAVTGGSVSGGLTGDDEGGVTLQSFATGAVTGSDFSGDYGGLIGLGAGIVEQSYATGNVLDSYAVQNISGQLGAVGGLVGVNYGLILLCYATGTATVGIQSAVGGLVGENLSAFIQDSFASGAVRAGANSMAGGLVGSSEVAVGSATVGLIANSYASGAVQAGQNSAAGGLVGANDFTNIDTSYSTGTVLAGTGSYVGGLLGVEGYGASTVTDSYWDTSTSSVSQAAGEYFLDAFSHGNKPVIRGLTTAQFKSGLPAGFSSSIWGESANINGDLPYLLALPPPKNGMSFAAPSRAHSYRGLCEKPERNARRANCM